MDTTLSLKILKTLVDDALELHGKTANTSELAASLFSNDGEFACFVLDGHLQTIREYNTVIGTNEIAGVGSERIAEWSRVTPPPLVSDLQKPEMTVEHFCILHDIPLERFTWQRLSTYSPRYERTLQTLYKSIEPMLRFIKVEKLSETSMLNRLKQDSILNDKLLSIVDRFLNE